MDGTLITIGVPTYNRAKSLERALQSIHGQSYERYSVIISDNASSDDTGSVARAFERSDERFSYYRQPANVGPTANIRDLLERASGEYFMWLADDDWMDSAEYLGQLAAELTNDPKLVLAAPVMRYFTDDVFHHAGAPLQCCQANGRERVLQYYREVADNGLFYGLFRRKVLCSDTLHNALGGDWTFLASVACAGSIRTVPSATLNRSWTWNPDYARLFVQQNGLPKWHAHIPRAIVCKYAIQDILGGCGAFADLTYPGRMRLGFEVGCIFAARFAPRAVADWAAALLRQIAAFVPLKISRRKP